MRKQKLSLCIAILFSIMVFICSWKVNGINQKDGKVFASDILESEVAIYSWRNEELIIRDFFNDRRGGVFVDIGCSHWMWSSNTCYLEKYLGWSGIAVDALNENAPGYIENRPNTKFFNFLITDHSGTVESFYRFPESPGDSSIYKELIKKQADRKKISENYQIVHVPTITLTELLEKNKINKIDFLSMDIEGSEPLALAGFDIKRFRPELVCIEVGNTDPNKILEYFTRHDYERIDKYLKYDKVNWYFKPKQ